MSRKWITKVAVLDGGEITRMPIEHPGYQEIRNVELSNVLIYLLNGCFEEAILFDIDFPLLDSSEIFRLSNQVRRLTFGTSKIFHCLEEIPEDYGQIFSYFEHLTFDQALEKVKRGDSNE